MVSPDIERYWFMDISAIAKGLFGAAVLLAFLALGVMFVVNPRWGAKHFGPASLLAGGEFRQRSTLLQLRLMGMIVCGGVLFILLDMLDK